MVKEELFKEFLNNLAESIELDPDFLNLDTKINDINWDSLAIISCIALADEYFEIMLKGDELSAPASFIV